MNLRIKPGNNNHQLQERKLFSWVTIKSYRTHKKAGKALNDHVDQRRYKRAVSNREFGEA